MKILTLVIITFLAAFPASAQTIRQDADGRYYVHDDDEVAVIFNGRRYSIGRDYYPYNYRRGPSPVIQELHAICADVRDSKKHKCMADAIKEREKLRRKYND